MIPYIGGKSYLSSWVIDSFPYNYREMNYCEVFGGGGWVLFKKELSYLEVYNDLNSSLVNIFRAIRDNYKEFYHRAEWSLHSREMFQEARMKLQDENYLERVEKAMHYALARVQSFSGKGESWAYGVNPKKFQSGKWLPFLNRLEAINARLKRVQIECMDFESLIMKYDTQETLFYLDPPYYGLEHYYKSTEVDFKIEDHLRLAKVLKKIKGKFVLSYYDHPKIAELYNDYRIIKKNATKHSVCVTKNTRLKSKPKSTELLIMNY